MHKSPFQNPRESRQLYVSCHNGRSSVRYDPTISLVSYFVLFVQGRAHQVLQESNLPIFETGCVGHPFHHSPVPNNVSIILNKDIGQRPLSEVTEGDPQTDGCNDVPHRIFDMHCHLGPSVGPDALKVKELFGTAT